MRDEPEEVNLGPYLEAIFSGDQARIEEALFLSLGAPFKMLMEAAFLGDRARVGEALDLGAPVNESGYIAAKRRERDEFPVGWATPLMAAVSSPRANRKVIDLLLDAGADLDAFPRNPFVKALEMNATEHALHLLDRGADPWLPELHILTAVEEPRVLRRLLASNPPVKALLSGLLSEGRSCRWKIPRLVRAGADPNGRFTNGETPLHRARRPCTVEALLAAGAQIDAVHEDVVKEDAGHETREFSRSDPFPGWTPLATMFQHTSDPADGAARLLIERGADVHFQHASGQTLFLAAVGCEMPSDGLIKALLDRGADPLATWNGNNAFHLFVARRDFLGNNDLGTFKLLVEAAVPVNARNDESATPLFVASRRHRVCESQWLLQAGADPNLALTMGTERGYRAGMTPLTLAYGNPELVRLLLDAGADPSIPDVTNRNPLDYAREILAYLDASDRIVHRSLHPDALMPFFEDLSYGEILADQAGRRERLSETIALLETH